MPSLLMRQSYVDSPSKKLESLEKVGSIDILQYFSYIEKWVNLGGCAQRHLLYQFDNGRVEQVDTKTKLSGIIPLKYTNICCTKECS